MLNLPSGKRTAFVSNYIKFMRFSHAIGQCLSILVTRKSEDRKWGA